ncbi:hypothetical protein P8452_28008 [Trifolium repens]|nr:hypothetical protein P8452_28008 [Trifolium repens]
MQIKMNKVKQLSDLPRIRFEQFFMFVQLHGFRLSMIVMVCVAASFFFLMAHFSTFTTLALNLLKVMLPKIFLADLQNEIQYIILQRY